MAGARTATRQLINGYHQEDFKSETALGGSSHSGDSSRWSQRYEQSSGASSA